MLPTYIVAFEEEEGDGIIPNIIASSDITLLKQYLLRNERRLKYLPANDASIAELTEVMYNIPVGAIGVQYQGMLFLQITGLPIPPNGSMNIFISYDGEMRPIRLYTIAVTDDDFQHIMDYYFGQPLPDGTHVIQYKYVTLLTAANRNHPMHNTPAIPLPQPGPAQEPIMPPNVLPPPENNPLNPAIAEAPLPLLQNGQEPNVNISENEPRSYRRNIPSNSNNSNDPNSNNQQGGRKKVKHRKTRKNRRRHRQTKKRS